MPSVTAEDTLLDTAVAAIGGAPREGQVRMAEAVARSIRTGAHLAVQAGTGTGKSLAYLVPAVEHAVRSGSTVVVSTSTIALQRQLIDRDLPRLADALEKRLGRRPEFAMLKGRRNYLCLHRLDSGPDEDEEPEALFDPFAASATERAVRRLREWAEQTTTGDRDELVPGVADKAWRQVSVTARECLGQRCSLFTECWAEKARGAAGRADIVVTNHSLLAIDALESAQVLPEHEVVIVDEAHDLVDRVTSAATAELTGAMVSTAVRRCGRLIDEATVDRLGEAGDAVAALLGEQPSGRLDVLPSALGNSLAALRDAAKACLDAFGPARKEEQDAATARKIALALLDDMHETAERMLRAFDAELGERFDVVWCTNDGERPAVLRIAPLTVSGLLRERLFGQSTTILASATLALGGSFEPLAKQWGLPAERPPAEPDPGTSTEKPAPSDVDTLRWTSLDVGSPFEHSSHGILYVAKHLPAPGRDGTPPPVLEELADLVDAAGGRTLGLFSSMRAAKAAAEYLRDKTELPILCQGEDSTGQLVRKFSEDPCTCLFGTLSLWQGVDVPGPSLQLVVLDRIPFPRPDDPLFSARQRSVDARGGNGFLTVAATHAALLIAQGTGRLLRTVDDRGVIAVLDPRFATARYSGFLRSSLPPYWPTSDPTVARAALHRLDKAAG
ncbi:ATP-dependent DNA helicase [Sciscionella sediminilitoris]|uniref:ATP-dependent DNA helicase n=1 Tax=Sciscionella sediminilitoris TaxID=1445613 RepID=UPI0004DF6D1C|nr:ATP-dependent DNA helicase [Sciscionella sp. SE31]